MKHLFLILLALALTSSSIASSVLIEGFEYGNHDLTSPVGWTCDDPSWLCGYQDKDHNRTPHTGNWYAFTNADESWMFMPLYFSTSSKYRVSCWAISDGDYDLEFWVGDACQPDQMVQLLEAFSIGSGEYEKVAKYIETLSNNYDYFGIHAIAHEGAACLTIDDINVDMVSKYEFIATPSSADTVLYPGSQVNHHFDVQNMGYIPITVLFSPSHEYFTDFHFYVNGSQCNSFTLEPDEVKRVTVQATLLPSVAPGSTCWLDIMLVLDCDCATSMTTLWVTVLDPAQTGETKETAVSLYPNPATSDLHIASEGLQKVEVIDLTGKTILAVTAYHDDLMLDITSLRTGIYFVRTTSRRGVTTKKFIKR